MFKWITTTFILITCVRISDCWHVCLSFMHKTSFSISISVIHSTKEENFKLLTQNCLPAQYYFQQEFFFHIFTFTLFILVLLKLSISIFYVFEGYQIIEPFVLYYSRNALFISMLLPIKFLQHQNLKKKLIYSCFTFQD